MSERRYIGVHGSNLYTPQLIKELSKDVNVFLKDKVTQFKYLTKQLDQITSGYLQNNVNGLEKQSIIQQEGF